MKKTLIAVAVIAAGAAGYYFKFGPGAAGQDSAVLEYVPADTVLLSAQLKPINMADYLASLGLFPQYYGAESQKSIQDLIATTTEPGMKFMLSLALSYMQAFEKPQELEKITGLKLSMRQLMYMVGVSPVVKLEVADEAAMWAMFDKAEKDSGYQHKTGNVGAINYRKYTFTMPEAELDLVVSVNNGWATIVLTSSKLDAANLSIALGATKPALSVVSSGKLKELSTKYQLNNESFGYISSQELVKALNSKDGNQLAKDVETLFGAEAGVALASWREPACQTDSNAIAASWPGMFIDSSFTIAASGMEGQSRIQIPTENKVTIEGLNLLRGFIPQQQLKLIGDKQMMNFAMGLDVAQMAVGVGKLWEVATTTTYTCPALVEMQTELKANNPMGALAMAGDGDGVATVPRALARADGQDAVHRLGSAGVGAVGDCEDHRVGFRFGHGGGGTDFLPVCAEQADRDRAVPLCRVTAGHAHRRRGALDHHLGERPGCIDGDLRGAGGVVPYHQQHHTRFAQCRP